MSTASSPSSLSAPVPGAATLLFNAGIPGFPQAKAFSLRSWATEESPFYVLECQDVLGLRFVRTAFWLRRVPGFGRHWP
jgi:hypothetical protein